MESIKIQKIIEENNLDKKEVALHLFPKNAYAVLALNRVIAGRGKLNSAQISKLASLANISIDAAYSGDWKTEVEKGVITFTSDEYLARLDTSTWAVKIYHKKSLFHKQVMMGCDITVSEFVANIDSIISEHIKNEK